MEPKKNRKADLENKRGLFLEIGLTVSLLVVIGAFSWSQKERVVTKIESDVPAVEMEIIPITREQEPPKQEPQARQVSVISDILDIVKDNTKIESTLTFDDFDEDIKIEPVEVEEEVIVEDAPFVLVEEMPTFQGGDDAKFRAWVHSKIDYPQIALDNGIQGRVTVQFVIERDGSLTNIKVLASPDSSLSDEATRVLKMSPKWKPGKQRNMAVRVSFTIPIEFQIQN